MDGGKRERNVRKLALAQLMKLAMTGVLCEKEHEELGIRNIPSKVKENKPRPPEETHK